MSYQTREHSCAIFFLDRALRRDDVYKKPIIRLKRPGTVYEIVLLNGTLRRDEEKGGRLWLVETARSGCVVYRAG